jgi:hypothetical protein
MIFELLLLVSLSLLTEVPDVPVSALAVVHPALPMHAVANISAAV